MQRERRVHLCMQRWDHSALQRIQGLHMLSGAVHNRLPCRAECVWSQMLRIYGNLQRRRLQAIFKRVHEHAV